MERMLERSRGGRATVGIDQRHTATNGREEQRPPTILTPANAREQHDRQGEETQDEAGMEVGPDQEDDRKPPARLRAPEDGVDDENPAEERVQLRADVEERRRHCQAEDR